jgi:hypothetical protein
LRLAAFFFLGAPFLAAVFFGAFFLARYSPTFFDECPAAATAAFNLAGVTLNFFDQ